MLLLRSLLLSCIVALYAALLAASLTLGAAPAAADTFRLIERRWAGPVEVAPGAAALRGVLGVDGWQNLRAWWSWRAVRLPRQPAHRAPRFRGSSRFSLDEAATLPVRGRCVARRRVLLHAGGEPLAETSCPRGWFSTFLDVSHLLGAGAMEIEIMAEQELGSPRWRSGESRGRVVTARRTFELVERRCDLDRDGSVGSADVRLARSILEGRSTPTGAEALQLDAWPLEAPDGVLDEDDLAVVERAAAGARALCEVPVRAIRGLRDLDGDGVVRVACLGDSNTCFGNPFACGPVRSWCSILQELTPAVATADGRVLPAEFVNFAWGGMTVCDHPTNSSWLGARPQYEIARNREEPADAVVMAFGTNDYGVLDKSPGEVVACYEDMVATAEADGVPAWIASTPPALSWPQTSPEERSDLAVRNRHVEDTNRLLRETFRVDSVVDFFSAFEKPELFLFGDPLHLNDDGQLLRAGRPMEVVR